MERAVRPLNRRKAEGTKFDFKLHFQASAVPISGWEKLVVSLLSIETGRITAKTSKGVIHNGTCQWPDPVVESIKLVQNPSTGEFYNKLYKLFVQMGSLRAGILGDTTLNLTEYITAGSPETVSLPLRNCTAGTVLHVKIQCLTPKGGIRDLEGPGSARLDQECPGSVSEDNSSCSDISENRTSGSVGSPARQKIAALSHVPASQEHYRNGGASLSRHRNDDPLSIAALRASFDVIDTSSNRSTMLGISKGYLNAEMLALGLENDLVPNWPYFTTGSHSASSQERNKLLQPQYQSGDLNFANQDSAQIDLTNAKLNPLVKRYEGWALASLPQKLEAAEATIQELREETSGWERQARKLAVEVETMRQKFAYESKHVSELNMKLSTTEAECESLKAEVDQLKAAKMAPKVWSTTDYLCRREMEDSKMMIGLLQEEIQYEKEVNANLQMQLKKTQDSNGDLLTALTELEETLQASNMVVERITEANKNLEEELFHARRELETSSKLPDDGEVDSFNVVGWKHSSSTVEEIMKEQEEKIKLLESQVQELKLAQQFSAEHEKINKFELTSEEFENTKTPSMSGTEDLLGMSEELKRKEEEVKGTCYGLTQDNAEPLSKPRNSDSRVSLETDIEGVGKFSVFQAGSLELPLANQSNEAQRFTNVLELQIQELEAKIVIFEANVYALEKEKAVLLQKIEDQSNTQTHLETEVKELVSEVNKLTLDVSARVASIKDLDFQLAEVKTENSALERSFQTLQEEREAYVSKMDGEKVCLLRKLDEAHAENNRKTEQLEDLEGEMERFRNDLSSHASENRRLESSNVELLAIQEELKARIRDLEELNISLSTEISSLEMHPTAMLQDQTHSVDVIEAFKDERLAYENQISDLQTHQTLLQQELKEAVMDCAVIKDNLDALKVQMMQQQRESEDREHILRLEVESLLDRRKSLEQAAKSAEEAVIAVEQDKFSSLKLLGKKLEQLTLVVDEKENVASHAMAKVAELQAEKVDLAKSLEIMEEKVKDLEQLALLQKALDIKARDISKELDASKILCNNLAIKLQEKESTLQEQLISQGKQEKEFQRKIKLLEEEKSESQERLQYLELEVKANDERLVLCKKDFTEKETELMGRIEDLEILNEELAAGSNDSGAEQLQKELIRLQNQNSSLSRREQELLSEMRTQEVLQEEVKRLQEANDLLEARLSKLAETAKNPFLLEKIVNLETELAEAVEANNMYKLQLISMFDKQQNGELDQVIDELYQHKKKATQLQGDLDSMRNMHIDVSLRCAQLQAERDELMMTVKNMKGIGKK